MCSASVHMAVSAGTSQKPKKEGLRLLRCGSIIGYCLSHRWIISQMKKKWGRKEETASSVCNQDATTEIFGRYHLKRWSQKVYFWGKLNQRRTAKDKGSHIWALLEHDCREQKRLCTRWVIESSGGPWLSMCRRGKVPQRGFFSVWRFSVKRLWYNMVMTTMVTICCSQ